MPQPNIPDIIKNEVSHILQRLSASWPMFCSLNLNQAGDISHDYRRFGRVLEAVTWLGDMGLINYESISSVEPVIELRGATITARGRDFHHRMTKRQTAGQAPALLRVNA